MISYVCMEMVGMRGTCIASGIQKVAITMITTLQQSGD